MPMLTLARDGFTEEEVKAALHGKWGQPLVSFRYDLLDKTNTFKSTLTTVESGSITHEALADIKRKARFTMKDDGTVNYLGDRIQPWMSLYVPHIVNGRPAGAGGFASWPLGVFILSTPEETFGEGTGATRDIEAYDQNQVLLNDKVDGTYLIPAGTKFVDAIRTLLNSAGITLINIADSAKTLPVQREWDNGTPKLAIINDLLEALNYYSLWFDGTGYATSSPYVLPSSAPSEYTYESGDGSVISLDGLKRRKDLFDVPNKWVFTVSQADRTPLKSIYVNDSPNSDLSTVNRGMTIVDYREVDAADQEALDGLVQRAANDASQVFETVTWESSLMPHHNHLDNYVLASQRLGGRWQFREISWSMDLRADGSITHSCRRTITV